MEISIPSIGDDENEMNAIDLRTRNAIVTGGAQGIGRCIAERLLDC